MRMEIVLLSLAVTGCAASGMRAPEPSAGGDEIVLQLEDQLYRTEAELLQGLEFVPTRDCERLCRLGENICQLAAKICDISGRHPDREDIRLRCGDGRTACESARSRLSSACDCLRPAPGPEQ